MKTCRVSLILSLFVTMVTNTLAISKDYNHKNESGWAKKMKIEQLAHFKNKLDSTNSKYPQPFLTIHLGVSYVINEANVQLNSGQTPGTKLNLHRDLGITNYFWSPRLNAIINFGNFHGIAFDTYTLSRKGNEVIGEDIKFGDTTFLAGNKIKTKLGLLYMSLAYSNFFYKKERARAAFLVGASGVFYNIKLTNSSSNDYTQKKSIFVVLPTVGLNASVYVCKNLFLRGVIKYAAWWSKNYNCNIIDFNPYFEYYIYKNLGLGMRYHYAFTSFKNLPDKKFDGSIKNSFNAISFVLVYRFMKKDSKNS